MEGMEVIILAVAALVFFVVLFFVIDLLNKSNTKSSQSEPSASQTKPESKNEPELEQKPKNSMQEKTEIHHAKHSVEEHDFTEERNRNNLANDIETLIEKDQKGDGIRHERASRRSLLVNAGRMRKYYEDRHLQHESKYLNYGIGEDNGAEENEIEVGNLKFTEDEIKKLVALQEIMKRKDS